MVRRSAPKVRHRLTEPAAGFSQVSQGHVGAYSQVEVEAVAVLPAGGQHGAAAELEAVRSAVQGRQFVDDRLVHALPQLSACHGERQLFAAHRLIWWIREA